MLLNHVHATSICSALQTLIKTYLHIWELIFPMIYYVLHIIVNFHQVVLTICCMMKRFSDLKNKLFDDYGILRIIVLLL